MDKPRFIEVETDYGKKTLAVNQVALIEDYMNETKIHMKATGNDNAQHFVIKETYKDFMKRFKDDCESIKRRE